MTQAELARRSGLSRGHIARIETGGYKGTQQLTFECLAKGLGLSLNELSSKVRGTTILETRKETPEEILDRLKLIQPVSIPVYTDFPFHAGEPVEAVEYMYRARTRATRMTIEAYIVHGKCLEPIIRNQDIIIVDREAAMDNGDIVAALVSGELHIGHLRKIADELYLENNDGRIKFDECQVAAPVIEVVRRLK